MLGCGIDIQHAHIQIFLLLLICHEEASDGLGQLFAQLDSILVVAIDVPQKAFDGSSVLIHRQQLAAGEGSQLLKQKRERGPVPWEELVGEKGFGDFLEL